MANAEPTRTSITLHYGAKGSHTFGGLIPACTDMEAYVTALGINMLQRHKAETVTKTAVSKLTRSSR